MKLMTFTVPEGLPRQKLLSLTARLHPEIPEYQLREAFAKRDVKVNGVRVNRDEPAVPGTAVQIYLPEAKKQAVPVIYRDEMLMIVRKPAGIACEEGLHGEKSIAEIAAAQLAEEGVFVRPVPAHRLDAPTEGLLVLALCPEAEEALTEAFREHRIEKRYLCRVKGTPSPLRDIKKAYLLKDARHAEVRVFSSPREGAKEIITEYAVLEEGPASLVAVTLHTGRTHQIRAHMAFLGHPLLGDDRYGDRNWNRENKARRLYLCAASLTFHTEGLLGYLNGKTFTTEPGFIEKTGREERRKANP